jgi:GAF domain-containing protein
VPFDYAERLAETRDLASVADVVRRAARDLAAADGATFVLRDGDLCFYADEDAIAPLWKGQRFPMSDCMSGWAMIHRQTAVVPDITVDPRIPQAAYRATFVRSMAMVPIRASDPLGAIGVYWAVQHVPPPERLAAVERLAAKAAETIDTLGMDTAPWAPNFRIWRSASIGVPVPR